MRYVVRKCNSYACVKLEMFAQLIPEWTRKDVRAFHQFGDYGEVAFKFSDNLGIDQIGKCSEF